MILKLSSAKYYIPIYGDIARGMDSVKDDSSNIKGSAKSGAITMGGLTGLSSGFFTASPIYKKALKAGLPKKTALGIAAKFAVPGILLGGLAGLGVGAAVGAASGATLGTLGKEYALRHQ